MSEDEQKLRIFRYVTAYDERVCPFCAPLDGSTFDEDELKLFFPNAVQVDNETYKINFHLKFNFLLGECRCEAHLVEEQEQQEKVDKNMSWDDEDPDYAQYLRDMADEPTVGGGKFAYWRAGRAAYSLRSPRAAMRFGARELFGAMGLGTLGTMLVPIIFFLIVPMINTITKIQVQMAIDARKAEEDKKRKAAYREAYRGLIPA
jgi:hypothetical protein